MTDQEEDDGSYPEDILLSLTGVRSTGTIDNGTSDLEQNIAGALGLAAERISIVDVEDGRVMFVVFPINESSTSGLAVTAEQLAQRLNGFIKEKKGNAALEEWLYTTRGRGAEDCDKEENCVAHCAVAEMEEEVEIEEEEAFQLWRDMPEESRTSHLAMVPSPDGGMVQPTHTGRADENVYGVRTAIEAQLQRDPSLLDFDNVPRIHISQLLDKNRNDGEAVSWSEPVVITGCVSLPQVTSLKKDNNVNSNSCISLPTGARLMERFGETEVRTGNRNTLVENGFDNSLPMALGKAIEDDSGDSSASGSRIVFSPVKELPDSFRQDLDPFLAGFPPFPSIDQQQKKQPPGEETIESKQKYTLCIAGKEGFGIGFHKHNAALFMLLVGRKKWYMGASSSLDQSTEPTHPGFYTSKSSHKCIQQPGEVLYVPDQWYHEIFNLEYTAGIQALPEC
jgi:hypothetical protein